METVKVYRCRQCGALSASDVHCHVKGLCDPVMAVPFSDLLDNHHNAAACPYCGDLLGAAEARAERAEAERDEAVETRDAMRRVMDEASVEWWEVLRSVWTEKAEAVQLAEAERDEARGALVLARLWTAPGTDLATLVRDSAEASRIVAQIHMAASR